MRDVVVIGAGMFRYGMNADENVVDMGVVAVQNALKDAGMPWDDIQTLYCGTGHGGMSAGHRICQTIGLTGLAVTNVENASASGSAAFREAYISVAAGVHDTAVALGVDTTPPHTLAKLKMKQSDEPRPPAQGPVLAFAAMARRHMSEYGTTIDDLAKVAVKSKFNGSHNPYAHFQEQVTLEEVHAARMVADPLTKLHCCPWDGGAAAVIIVAKELAEKYTDKFCPTVLNSQLTSMLPDRDPMAGLTEYTATLAYAETGINPKDLDLIEMHDAFTIEEVVYYESLGLCERGEGGSLIQNGVTEITGKHPVNSSGGLISMGHPVGPTGVGQVAEILWQMRKECGKRQITKQVDIAMAHMVGAGGVCIIHLFKR